MYEVYIITCAVNAKRYIGYTSKTAAVRFSQHLDNARWNRKTAFYDAVRKYGADQFSVETVLQCPNHAEACAHEIRLIAEFGSLAPTGYNLTLGGDGVPLTDEQREKANAKKRGRFTEAQRAAAIRRRGVKASEETKLKLSEARRGRAQDPEHVRKRVETFRRNRAMRLGIPYVEKAIERRRTGPKRVWTPELREAERVRALAQWTPEAKKAARQRAAKQWTPEARQVARDRINIWHAKQRAERENA